MSRSTNVINLTVSSSPPKASSSGTKKRALADSSNGDGNSASSSKAPKGKKAKPTYESYQDVVLEGEYSGEVPVYDCCTTIRKKINKYLTEGHTAPPSSGTSAASTRTRSQGEPSYLWIWPCRFRKESGPNGGAANQVYPAAYIFFEKHRIFENKPKTASRQSSEHEFPRGRPLEPRRYGYFPTKSGKLSRRKIK
ncbi:hypothetical protein RQP46_009939 [Phenoliferia psychrophenolica]